MQTAKQTRELGPKADAILDPRFDEDGVELRETQAAGQERDFLREILQPEVTRGTITKAELDAVCGSLRERRRFVRAGKGHKNHRSAKHVIRATFDLAHEIAKSNGAESPGVEHERKEIARLRAA